METKGWMFDTNLSSFFQHWDWIDEPVSQSGKQVHVFEQTHTRTQHMNFTSKDANHIFNHVFLLGECHK